MLTRTLFILFAAFLTSSACPDIVTRSEWGARPGRSSTLQVKPPPYVIIHHSATGSCSNKAQCMRMVKSFQNHHIDTNKWGDIGYNFVVGEDGNVYEGRGWGKTGAHAPKYNDKSIGICVIGTFTNNMPNNAALSAVKDLISCGVSKGEIKNDYTLLGHRQVRATECPGRSLYDEIKTWPNWSAEI